MVNNNHNGRCRQNAIFSFDVPLELLDFKEVLEKFRRLAGIPKNQFARMIGCPYANFKRICNPDENYYPSVMTVLAADEVFQEHIGFVPLTEWQARQLGYTLIRLEGHPMVTNTTPEQDACRALSQASVLLKDIGDALEDGQIQPEEARMILADIEKLQTALAQLKKKCRELVEKEKAGTAPGGKED